MRTNGADKVGRAAAEATTRYFRLVLVVGPAGSGKTSALRAATAPDATVLNLGSALAARLLPLSKRQRALQAQALLETLVEEAGTDPVLLDNLEILFDPALQQDVLRLLQGLSRNRTIVASWPGEYRESVFSYAEPGHPEHVRYSNPEAVVVSLSSPGTPTP